MLKTSLMTQLALTNLHAGIKSKSHHYKDVGLGFVDFCKFVSPKHIYGLHEEQAAKHVFTSEYYDTTAIAEDFMIEDEAVFRGESLVIFEAFMVHGKPRFMLVQKSPYIENNKIQGCFFLSTILPLQTIESTKTYLDNPDIKISSHTKKFLDIFNLCPSRKYGLSKREMQTIIGLTQGSSARQIGEKLQLSRRTVESYIRNIKDKLQAQTQTEIVAKTIKEGLV